MQIVTEVEKAKSEVLVAENVEVDMETLRIAQCVSSHPLARERAHQRIIEAVINALDPKDRQQFEAYQKGEQ